MKRALLVLFIILVAVLVIKTNAQMMGLHALTRLTPHTFADLSMADHDDRGAKLTDGYITYCSDCAKPATPGATCASGGPGAEAHRIRGAWSCF